jgi:GrpB-like predicted nucleotidyltransferase (UPF0157 family)
MPFPDEVGAGVAVVEYDAGWPAEFVHLAGRLRRALGELALAVDHVGSTSVPGLPANCSDAQVRVAELSPVLIELMESAGFRCRPEPWNRTEISNGYHCEKLVFGPPIGERATNVHLRRADGPNARFALLFRDYLRANPAARDTWGAFKQRLAQSVPDLADYGQIKAPATTLLMLTAEQWSTRTSWTVPPIS